MLMLYDMLSGLSTSKTASFLRKTL